jgi:hypothetical protein
MGTEGDTTRSEPTVELRQRWWTDPQKAHNVKLLFEAKLSDFEAKPVMLRRSRVAKFEANL